MAKTNTKKDKASKKTTKPAASKKKLDAATAAQGDVADQPKVRRFKVKKTWRQRFFALQYDEGEQKGKLPSAWMMLKQSLSLPWRHWEVFGGILLIYAIANIILVGGIANSGELQSTKDGLADVFTGNFRQLSTGLTLFAYLVASGSGTASGVAAAYQTILLLITSLVIIWSLRQFYANNKIRIRDAYYNALTPLIKFLIVLLIVVVRLVPAVVGGFIFSALITGGILTHWYEQVPVILVSIVMLSLSVYWLINSIFALYIVTLPDMAPLAALRSSSEIVAGRQLQVMLKLLFMPLVMTVATVVIMVPIALFATGLAPLVFFILSAVGVVAIHSYMYSFYRALIAK